VLVLFVIIGHRSTNWILEQSSVSLSGTLQDKEGTNAGVHLKGGYVRMDVTFRESEPFYGEKTDLSVSV
jgi:hypothetical protein